MAEQLAPEYRALLDTIAGSEAPGYNYIYGGKTFNDFTDHPRQYVPITSGPNVGQKTSAAGRYQFLGSSWDEAQKALGLPDFSPDSQDAAAIWAAERAYKSKTGGELLDALRTGKVDNVGQALSGYWTSLPGGIEPNKQTNSFATRYASALGQPMQQMPPQAGAAASAIPPAAVPYLPSAAPTAAANPQQADAAAIFAQMMQQSQMQLPEAQPPIFPQHRKPVQVSSLKTNAPYLGRGFYPTRG